MWYLLHTNACVPVNRVFVFTLTPSGPDSGLSRNTTPTGVGTGDPSTEWDSFTLGRDASVQELE